MKLFLTQTISGGIASLTREVAQQLRDSLPKEMQKPTIEIVPVRPFTKLAEQWEAMIPSMSRTLSPGEKAVHEAALRDLKQAISFSKA